MKHVSICPLAGGLPLGAELALDQPPEFVISDSAFDLNDQFYMNYMESKGHNLQRFCLDKQSDREYLNPKMFSDIKLATIVPPCSGLSRMCNAYNEIPMLERAPNQWMFKFATFAMDMGIENILIENAPALTKWNSTTEIRHYLRKLGTDRNYYPFFIYTDTNLHGIPQSRRRSFFGYSKNGVPNFKQHKVDHPDYVDYLNSFPITPDQKRGSWHISQNELWPFIQKFNVPLLPNRKLFSTILSSNLSQEFSHWAESNGLHKYVRMCQRSLTKEVWDSTPLVCSNSYTRTVTGRFMKEFYRKDTLNSFSDRDCFRLMAMPDDYPLPPPKYMNIVAQNVPVTTGKVWSDALINTDYLSSPISDRWDNSIGSWLDPE
jgi:site-specific DNA-cytosine methylase